MPVCTHDMSVTWLTFHLDTSPRKATHCRNIFSTARATIEKKGGEKGPRDTKHKTQKRGRL